MPNELKVFCYKDLKSYKFYVLELKEERLNELMTYQIRSWWGPMDGKNRHYAPHNIEYPTRNKEYATIKFRRKASEKINKGYYELFEGTKEYATILHKLGFPAPITDLQTSAEMDLDIIRPLII
jgi:hypothetical protein